MDIYMPNEAYDRLVQALTALTGGRDPQPVIDVLMQEEIWPVSIEQEAAA